MTQQSQEVRGLGPEAFGECLPALRVALRERRDPRRGGFRIRGHAAPATVGKGRRERVRDRNELQPAVGQVLAVILEEGASGEQRDVRRGPVVAKARQRVLTGLDRPARRRILFEDAHAPTARAEVHRGGEGVVTRTDQNGV